MIDLDFTKMNNFKMSERWKNRTKLWISIPLTFCIMLATYFPWKSFNTNTVRAPALEHATSMRDIPICMGNLLNAQKYDFTKWTRVSSQFNQLFSESTSCRLVDYTQEQIVKCFDNLNRQRTMGPNLTNSDTLLHFVFMGDSRIRQKFYNFLKMIPDYDNQRNPGTIAPVYQGDFEVTSKILQLRISFKWCALIDTKALTIVKEYLTDTQVPHMILLGMELHHIVPKNNATLLIFQERLEELSFYLDKLGSLAKVIWLNQFPTLDLYGENDKPITIINSEKIKQYNEVALRTLRPLGNIFIWDSMTKLAEEYNRGCGVNIRHSLSLTYPAGYTTNCEDFIHTGNIAVFEAMQLLFNEMCNTHLV